MNACLESPAVVRTDLTWDNSFQRLGPSFYTPLAPQPLPAPYWVGRSTAAAGLIGLAQNELTCDDWLQALSGNLPVSGTQPLASVYSGHQFGQWAGQLGDGRAILLGETGGWEVQLKGSGLTPYSRMGDGRAVLRSSIREFLCSEAMHALGIPTSRALCVTGSDAPVRRETLETAAVVTRLAPSFIRFGHFEHFSARNQLTELKALADYVIERHYPNCRTGDGFAGNAYAALLAAVTQRTAVMVAHWQASGFCHGVMNTDNMSILGLTLDYGPFQFMDAFDPGRVCNHSDNQGRYAFGNQPDVAHWNLFCLGQALLPLIDDTALAHQALGLFKPVYLQHWHGLMTAKLGLRPTPPTGPQTALDGDLPSPTQALDAALVHDILALLAQDRVDYTIFWRRLSVAQRDPHATPVRDLFLQRASFDAWYTRYLARLGGLDQAAVAASMLACNPKFVLRNHLGELAIKAAQARDFSALETLQKVLENPFDEHPEHPTLADFPPDWAASISISCSS